MVKLLGQEVQNRGSNQSHKVRSESSIKQENDRDAQAQSHTTKQKIISKDRHPQKLKNKHGKRFIWNERFKNFIKHKQKVYESQDSFSGCEFSCPICLEMLLTPCPTSCGHIFCFRCIDQCIIRNSNCPSCRNFVRNEQFIESKAFSDICNYFWICSKEKELYLQKAKKNQEWLKCRLINKQNISVGLQLDVRDTQYIWCKARVIQIYTSQNKLQLLIHFQGWNDIYNEVINVNSQRLAPFQFFSGRTDIPAYRLSEPHDNMRSRIQYRDQRDFQRFRNMIRTLPRSLQGMLPPQIITFQNFSNSQSESSNMISAESSEFSSEHEMSENENSNLNMSLSNSINQFLDEIENEGNEIPIQQQIQQPISNLYEFLIRNSLSDYISSNSLEQNINMEAQGEGQRERSGNQALHQLQPQQGRGQEGQQQGREIIEIGFVVKERDEENQLERGQKQEKEQKQGIQQQEGQKKQIVQQGSNQE